MTLVNVLCTFLPLRETLTLQLRALDSFNSKHALVRHLRVESICHYKYIRYYRQLFVLVQSILAHLIALRLSSVMNGNSLPPL